MKFKRLQYIILFSLVLGFSTPAKAFWGEATISRWATNVASSTKSLFSAMQEHKKAIIIGVSTVATLGLGILALGVWDRRQTQLEADADTERVAAAQRLGIEQAEAQARETARLEAERLETEEAEARARETARLVEVARRKPILEGAAQAGADRLAAAEARRVEQLRLAEEAAQAQLVAELKAESRRIQVAREELLKRDEQRKLDEEQAQIIKAKQVAAEQAEEDRLAAINFISEFQASRSVSADVTHLYNLSSEELVVLLEDEIRWEEERRSSSSSSSGAASSSSSSSVSPLFSSSTSGELRSLHEALQTMPFGGPTSLVASSSRQAASSISLSQQQQAVSFKENAFITGLGLEPAEWLKAPPVENFNLLAESAQREIIHCLAVYVNDGQPVEVLGNQGFFSEMVKAIKRRVFTEKSEHQTLFEFYYDEARAHARLAVPMMDIEEKIGMTDEKKTQLGELLRGAFAQLQDGNKVDTMGQLGSDIIRMESDEKPELNFMVKILRPEERFGESEGIALFVPIHGTYATSGAYGSGANNAENGPRLMAAAQRMANEKKVTLHVIIPNWNGKFEEQGREEAACYILSLIQNWYLDHAKDDIKFIDFMGHSEGNTVIALMLKGIVDSKLRAYIRWLSVCPTAGSDYVPVGCRARVTIWSPEDALAFIASVTRFNSYRKQSNLNQFPDHLFMNVSLGYDGAFENHVTAKYRASELYDIIFDIAEKFRGQCELSMDVNSSHKEVLVAIRRGKESSFASLAPGKAELHERISRVSEARYRAFYPTSPSWHKTRHDWASFAFRGTLYGLREKADGNEEDRQIAAAGKEPNPEMQQKAYHVAQEQVRGRISYATDISTEQLDMSDDVRNELSSIGFTDRDTQEKMCLGNFVHGLFAHVGKNHDLDSIRNRLFASSHRHEFIAALITYWQALGAKRNQGKLQESCAFQVIDFTKLMYEFIVGAQGASPEGKRAVRLDNDSLLEMDSVTISLHGLPCQAERILVTPLEQDHSRFYIKLIKAEEGNKIVTATTTAVEIVAAAVTGATGAVSALYKRARGIQKTQAEKESGLVPVDSASIVEDFTKLLTLLPEDERIQPRIRRARFGGVREIVKVVESRGFLMHADASSVAVAAISPQLAKIRAKLKSYDSLLLRIADEIIIFPQDEPVQTAYQAALTAHMFSKDKGYSYSEEIIGDVYTYLNSKQYREEVVHTLKADFGPESLGRSNALTYTAYRSQSDVALLHETYGLDLGSYGFSIYDNLVSRGALGKNERPVVIRLLQQSEASSSNSPPISSQ